MFGEASVAKWLRQWVVIPSFAGSSPVVRPYKFFKIFVRLDFLFYKDLLLSKSDKRDL